MVTRGVVAVVFRGKSGLLASRDIGLSVQAEGAFRASRLYESPPCIEIRLEGVSESAVRGFKALQDVVLTYVRVPLASILV